jgi:hypothetical protein
VHHSPQSLYHPGDVLDVVYCHAMLQVLMLHELSDSFSVRDLAESGTSSGLIQLLLNRLAFPLG